MKNQSPDYKAGFLAGLDKAVELCETMSNSKNKDNNPMLNIIIATWKRGADYLRKHRAKIAKS